MEPARYLAALRRSWWVIALLGAIGMVAGYAWSASQAPLYRSSSSVFFQVVGADNTNSLLQGSSYTQSQVRSYAVIATQPIVLREVIDQLDLDTSVTALAKRIDASIPLDTVIVEISAVAGSPSEARSIAQGVAEQLGQTMEEISQQSTSDGAITTVRARIVGDASTPLGPFSPNPKEGAMLGLFAGVALGVALALARELLNNRVSNEDILASVTDLPLLGQIPVVGGTRPQPQPFPSQSVAQTEAFRRAAANLDFIGSADGVQAVVITSSSAGEGKSTLAANLARILAESKHVLLLEGDLRNPALAERLGLDPSVGLTSVITGKASLEDALQRSGPLLDVLLAGPIPPNAVSLINSSGFRHLMTEVRAKYDMVIIDGAPLLPVTDSALLAKIADGALIVVNSRKTSRKELKRALHHLALSGAPVHGAILTMTPMMGNGYAYYMSASEQPSRAAGGK